MPSEIMPSEYSAGLMSQSFWFVEFKKYLKLVDSGKKPDEIKRIVVDENLFGAPNEYRAKRYYGYISARASRLDSQELELFWNSDLQTQKLINLICVLRGDRLFFEFLYEVYREKHILGAEYLEPADGRIFFKNKGVQSEAVEGWKDTTRRKVQNCYFNFMTDCGLLTDFNGKKSITPPLLDIVLEQYMKANGEENMVKAITGVA